jgi:hypothetical protein
MFAEILIQAKPQRRGFSCLFTTRARVRSDLTG